jgi:geranylgeranyl diphosphate synthase type I
MISDESQRKPGLRQGPFVSRTARLQAMNAGLDRELARLAQRTGSTESALLTEMLQYHLGLRHGARPGKRLRANLVLLIAEALGRRWSEALWAAVAVELLHNFSLVFDDVQDRDDTRRGRAALWKVWGPAQAINAGAALEALVTGAVVELLPPRQADRLRPALLLLTDTMVSLCRGQALDLQFEQRVDVTVDEYVAMTELKTARLFECAARLGGIAAACSAPVLERAGAFGLHLGQAYQVIDDMQGIWGRPRALGKPVGSDLRNGKKTLPILLALHRGPAAARRQLRALLTHASFSASELDEARTILAQAGSAVQCRKEAAEQLAEARLNLFRISDRPNWALRALAEMVDTLESGLSSVAA